MKSFRIVLVLLCMHAAGFLKAQSVGGTTSGATTYCSYTNSGFIGLSGQTGSVVNWQFSTNGGATWTNNTNTLSSQGYSNLTVSTCYRAVVKNGAFPADTSSITCITINQPTVPGTVSGGTTFCSSTGSGTLNLTGSIGSVVNWQSSTNGGATWTTISNTTTTLNYSGLTQTTMYEAVVQNTAACAIDTSTAGTVTILAPSVSGSLSLSGNDTVCYFLNSGAVNLVSNVGAVVNWMYSTNNGTTWTTISNTGNTQTFSGLVQNTWYEAIVQNGTCPADTTSPITVSVFAPPAPVNAGPDTTLQAGQSVQLNGTGTGLPLWIPSTGLSTQTSYNPVATPPGTTSYTLVVTDANGCINADTVLVTVNNPVFNGVASNYFSPNGDGVNDTWFIQDILYFPTNEVFVYNIYGQQVYTKKGYTNDWKGTYNGSDLPDGTYYYVLRFSDTSTVLKGSVDILRRK